MGMENEAMNVVREQSYEEIKGIIRGKLSSVAESFVSIGFRLKQIRDAEMYKADGYKDIWEFAEKEYNLSQASTSRFMSINDKYAVDGYSPFLIPQYARFGWSKLSEMLSLTDEQLKLVSDRTTRVEIRELKKMNTEGIEAENDVYAHAHKTEESIEITQSEPHFSEGENDRIPNAKELMIDFFRIKDRRQIMKDLAKLLSRNQLDKEIGLKAAEIINPSGHLMYRKGMVVLMFEEDHIKYNKFGGQTTNYTYLDFLHDLLMIFDMTLEDPWVAFYGEPEPDPIPEPEPPKKEQSQTKPVGKKPEPVKDSKPAPNSEEKKPEKTKEEAPLLGQIEIGDYPGTVPEEMDEVQQSDTSWQQGSDDCSEEPSMNELEEQFEVVEADIVHSQEPVTKPEIEVKYDAETGEVEVYLDRSQGIHLIKVIDTGTGESWEVTIN
jgi:hypothetical protein